MGILKRFKKKVFGERQKHGPVYDVYENLDCLFEDEHCAIYFHETDGDRVIVSFTGVGHALGGIDVQRPEFLKASSFGSLVFVIDKNRSWGNNLDLDAITRVIRQASDDKPIHCLGNSMGGFLAILFSKPLGAERVIAFTPQWSIDPQIVPGEKNWETYRNNIARIRYRDLRDSFDPACSYLAVFGNDTGERVHCQFFEHREEVELFRIRKTGHEVAKYLKDKGVLYDLMSGWFDGNDAGTILRQKRIAFDGPGRMG